MINRPTCEVCVDGVTGAIAAQSGGAHRLELCQTLSVGGTTPSVGLMRSTKASVDLPVHVLIRPRAGDFHFDTAEFDVMRRDIEAAGESGAEGVVIGSLETDGGPDVERTARLVEDARPMSVTFHRAFDVVPDADAALEGLICLGIDRVLTSGQASSAWEGRGLLRHLVDAAGGRIVIMPGAGIDETHVGELIHETGVQEVHFSARREVVMATGDRAVTMGNDGSADRVRGVTDAERVRAIIAAASAASVR